MGAQAGRLALPPHSTPRRLLPHLDSVDELRVAPLGALGQLVVRVGEHRRGGQGSLARELPSLLLLQSGGVGRRRGEVCRQRRRGSAAQQAQDRSQRAESGRQAGGLLLLGALRREERWQWRRGWSPCRGAGLPKCSINSSMQSDRPAEPLVWPQAEACTTPAPLGLTCARTATLSGRRACWNGRCTFRGARPAERLAASCILPLFLCEVRSEAEQASTKRWQRGEEVEVSHNANCLARAGANAPPSTLSTLA